MQKNTVLCLQRITQNNCFLRDSIHQLMEQTQNPTAKRQREHGKSCERVGCGRDGGIQRAYGLGKKTNKVNYLDPLGLPGTDLVVQRAYKSQSWKNKLERSHNSKSECHRTKGIKHRQEEQIAQNNQTQGLNQYIRNKNNNSKKQQNQQLDP